MVNIRKLETELWESADEAAGFDIDIDPDDIDVSDTVTVLWEIG